MKGNHEIGAELRAALKARGCALSAAEARALSVALIGLVASGLLVAETSAEAVHDPRADRRGAGVLVGLGDKPETAPTSNTGQSLYIQGGDRE